jgi:hypothetical protein
VCFYCLSLFFYRGEQVKRLTEFEALYAHEREEKLLMESRMNQRAADLQEALRQVSCARFHCFVRALVS